MILSCDWRYLRAVFMYTNFSLYPVLQYYSLGLVVMKLPGDEPVTAEPLM